MNTEANKAVAMNFMLHIRKEADWWNMIINCETVPDEMKPLAKNILRLVEQQTFMVNACLQALEPEDD